MSVKNCTRSGCKDVFHAFLVDGADYERRLEIPCLLPENTAPEKLISFSKAVSGKDTDGWVHFYEDDVRIERIWHKPNSYLTTLKRYKGVLSPDFSLYRDMPLVMQQWNTYRGRAKAIGYRRMVFRLFLIYALEMNAHSIFVVPEFRLVEPLQSAHMDA